MLNPSNRPVRSIRVRYDGNVGRWADLRSNVSPWVKSRTNNQTVSQDWR